MTEGDAVLDCAALLDRHRYHPAHFAGGSPMVRTALAYVAALVAIGVMDFVWLRLVAMDWYQDGMGHLMAPSPNVLGAALFYVLFPVGVVLFVVMPAGGDVAKALVMGALFGVF